MSTHFNKFYRVALSEEDILNGNILGESTNAFEALMQAKAKGIPDYKLYEFTAVFREITQDEVKQGISEYLKKNLYRP